MYKQYELTPNNRNELLFNFLGNALRVDQYSVKSRDFGSRGPGFQSYLFDLLGLLSDLVQFHLVSGFLFPHLKCRLLGGCMKYLLYAWQIIRPV